MRWLFSLSIAIFLVACSQQENALQNRLNNINELELIQVTLSKSYTIRDAYDEDIENGEFDILNTIEHYVKKGGRVGVYGLRRTYSAYINLAELTDNDIKINGNNAYIKLPQIQIKILGNDIIPTIYHERVNGLRFPISESERIAVRKQATEELDEKVTNPESEIAIHMKNQAEQKCYAWLEALLRDWGYTPIISFKSVEDEAD